MTFVNDDFFLHTTSLVFCPLSETDVTNEIRILFQAVGTKSGKPSEKVVISNCGEYV